METVQKKKNYFFLKKGQQFTKIENYRVMGSCRGLELGKQINPKLVDYPQEPKKKKTSTVQREYETF